MKSYPCLFFFMFCFILGVVCGLPQDIDFERNEILFYKRTVKGKVKIFE